LNGAQTVTTFTEFLDSNSDNQKLNGKKAIINSLYVMCKIITEASQEFVTSVTINNNRQNPVEPWNLHANDMIQLQLQDMFRDELGIFYERQENSFEGIDREEEDIVDTKPLELVKLAQTFMVTDGNISQLSNMRQVFEDDNYYSKVFNL
jgi:hypothetical protein